MCDLATRIEPKWTIRNEEWVQVLYEIQRGPKGLSDRPATLPAPAAIQNGAAKK